jgi:hypothetical protein
MSPEVLLALGLGAGLALGGGLGFVAGLRHAIAVDRRVKAFYEAQFPGDRPARDGDASLEIPF